MMQQNLKMKQTQLLMMSKNCYGLALVELMIASVIGLIVLTGSAAIYLAAKQSGSEVERMMKMSESSRFAMEMLSTALQHAGFMGELPASAVERDIKLSPIAADCSGAAAAYSMNYSVYAVSSDANGHALGCITDAIPGTTVLVIKNVRPMPIIDTDADGSIDSPQRIDSRKTYVMANHVKAIMFDGADPPPSIIEGGDVPAGIGWIYQPQIFYIRNSSSSLPHLSRKMLQWNGSKMAFKTEDLVAGVEQLALLLALDSNGDGEIDNYQSILTLPTSDWRRVKAIEINLLIISDSADPSYVDTKIYKLTGTSAVGPKMDNFHRMVSKHTILLRNSDFVIRGNL